MPASTRSLSETLYSSFALTLAVLQLALTIWLVVAAADPTDDHRNYLWVGLALVFSACLLAMSATHPYEKKYLIWSALVNIAVLMGVWSVVLFFPSWLLGEYLAAYGGHVGLAVVVSLLNSVPVSLCIWRYSTDPSKPVG